MVEMGFTLLFDSRETICYNNETGKELKSGTL